MARFDLVVLEQNALKREKIEKRRGSKPVRASLLWAQTAWLEGIVALDEGSVVFQQGERQWNFDGVLLESTKRALHKLEFRTLTPEESTRLAERQQKLALWSRCSSLENLSSATLLARLVLESMVLQPLQFSPARELANWSHQFLKEIIEEVEDETFPDETRMLVRWVRSNRGAQYWQDNLSYPVNLACRLGFDGSAMPAFLEKQNELALGLQEITALAQNNPPEAVRRIGEFWSEARWIWPDVRTLYPMLQRKDAVEFGRAWHEMEETWRSRWTELWREMALHDVEAARQALQFHELWIDQDLSPLHDRIRRPAIRKQLLNRCEASNNLVYELLWTVRQHPNSALLIEFLSELWLEYDEVQREEFFNGVVVPMFKAARLVGIPTARELRIRGHLCLVRGLDATPEVLRLGMEWAQRGEGLEWRYQLASLVSNNANVEFLRREAEKFFALYNTLPSLEAKARGELWDEVLVDDKKLALNPTYWHFVRVLTPLFVGKMQQWHADDTSYVRGWLPLWAGLACDLGWTGTEIFRFCEEMLLACEREFKTLDKPISYADNIEAPLEAYVYLCYFAGDTIEQTIERCGEVIKWLARGKTDRTLDWWNAQLVARKLKHRPHLCMALLLAAKRSPGCVREILPQVESLQRLHLATDLDVLEEVPPHADAELGELLSRYPDLELSITALNQWQLFLGEAPHCPAGVRDVLEREMKWQREADFLRLRLAQQPNNYLQARLSSLENRLNAGSGNVEEELEAMLEAANEGIVLGALRALVTRALRVRLRALCGPVADELEWNDDLGNALLLACEVDRNRKWATKLLRGQSQNSSGWQRFIPANQEWLHTFANSGKDRDAFDAQWRVQIGEWELWIERDALQILQMGNRFATCLSRGGCNAHSTIANAIDANKIVVYAQREGQIQARQLWAVTSDGKLGGFRVYSTLSKAAREKSDVQKTFFEFAERFAHACGLELNEDTDAEIPEICGAEWYNDGLISWNSLTSTNEPLESKVSSYQASTSSTSELRHITPRPIREYSYAEDRPVAASAS